MVPINDFHAGPDAYPMDVDPPQSPPTILAQASTVGPDLSIEPPPGKRVRRPELDQYERFIRSNYHRMELKELRKLILKEHGFVAR